MEFLLGQQTSDARDRLLVLELPEVFRVAVSLLEDFGEFLFFFGGFVLLLAVLEQHVHFADQQRLGVLKLCEWDGIS